MQQYVYAIQLLDFLCQEATIDGIDFWGPKIILSTTRKNESQVTAPISCTIEGSLTYINDKGSYFAASEEEKLYFISRFRRESIRHVKLDLETLDLQFEFANGDKLICHGENGQYESWKLETFCGTDYVGVIACPDAHLAVFEPKDGNLKETFCYITFDFYAEHEVDVAEFKRLLPIDLQRSYSKGDRWQRKGPYEFRKWSMIKISSPDSLTYDATPMLMDFLQMLEESTAEIVYLKEKYATKIYVDIVCNIHSNEMPFIELTPKQMAFLHRVNANVRTYVYNYL